MSRRGHGSNWQGSHNPNMAPLPPRPRGGIGSSNHYGHSASSHSASSHSASPYSASPYSASPYSASAHFAYGDRRSPAPEPTCAASSTSSCSVGAQMALTVFVGSISPGISDAWLTKLFEACGNLGSLRRASKAFGFAEYADPDSVLRAIQVLHGRELPSMGAEASAAPNRLLVRADERTKRFLDQYQQTRVASADHKARESRALSAVKDIVRQMNDPNVEIDLDPSKPGYVVPDHLKDLPPEELPEDQRATVLSEIQQFRQAAAARDAETRRREAEFERQRAMERARRAHLQAAAASSSSSSSSSSSLRNGHSADDPQSYRRPLDFHSASSYDAKADIARQPEEADQVEEQQRQGRKKAAAADAERAYLVRERQRLAHWEKEQDKEQAENAKWERDGVALLKRWSDWRDDTATRKELFYTDRQRWRQLRAPARNREEQADQRDRAAEQEEKAKAQQETDNFLAQQAAEMAKLAEQQRKSGVLVQSQGGTLAPIKLSFANKADTGDTAATSNGEIGGAAPNKPAVLGEAEEDEQAKRTGRLKHIKLGTTMSEEENKAKLAQIEQSLPNETAALFAQEPKWEYVDEALIQNKYRPWVDAEIEESLGEKVEELVSVVIQGLQVHLQAKGLVESVEPVLAEEAEAFVEKLWRLVIVDSLAAAKGIPI
ncbi:related to SNU71-component of U1 snRNP required for mRNA splicing via spliceosome [Ustilago bromivora]|uniref:Related to SNU71 - component of U1 snRNP required for mRNA splicing via spliceosome n=1 Tax=Ustilago bromivora TaxID=307758 RepID=A0A1K0H8H3_9BASI|nr:related to SNU71-component of U1 snRNP required for mRNA splicing via spliceosome [Ustilago bromivora]SYW79444.1 related to SNU71 - component of U1 snRNP required for mRNA splicing via spliceosome [Ustilago bromivora]